MSSKGSYLRGEKWYYLNNKSIDGLAGDILNDVNVYLDSQKKVEIKPNVKEKK